jgi:general secretion pathway protein C
MAAMRREMQLIVPFRLRGVHLYWLFPLLLGLATAYAVTGVIAHKGVLDVGSGFSVPVAALDTSGMDAREAVILDKNIFGLFIPEPESAEPAAPAGSDPKSWAIVGTFMGARSMIIVSVQGRTEYVRVGETLEGWTLVEIRSDMLVWERGKQQREISLWGDSPGLGVKVEPSAGGSSSKRRVRMAKSEIAPVLNDPNAFLQQALFKPYKEGGKVRGFRIDNIKKNSLLAKLGLQNKDVLMRINGETIDGPAAMMAAYSGFGKANAVSLDVRREGSIISIFVDLK